MAFRSIQDLDRLGPIVESLLQSKKLTDDEKWAVDLSCRAATDLARIRHSELALRGLRHIRGGVAKRIVLLSIKIGCLYVALDRHSRKLQGSNPNGV